MARNTNLGHLFQRVTVVIDARAWTMATLAARKTTVSRVSYWGGFLYDTSSSAGRVDWLKQDLPRSGGSTV